MFHEEVANLIPDDNDLKSEVSKLPKETADLLSILQERVKRAVQSAGEKDIATQCNMFSQWEQQRRDALEVQRQRLLKTKRLSNIADVQKKLQEKETLLWYFENEEKIELEIEENERLKQEEEGKKWVRRKATDEIHIPYEVSRPFKW